MAAYKTRQHFLVHRGREFHFVSYEGRAADAAKRVDAMPPTWYLIAAGKRWEVMAEEPGEPEERRADRLAAWLDAHVFGD